jgi:hypothetical protein
VPNQVLVSLPTMESPGSVAVTARRGRGASYPGRSSCKPFFSCPCMEGPTERGLQHEVARYSNHVLLVLQ